jgi:hypothetical protein
MIRKIALSTFETKFVFQIDTKLFTAEKAKCVNDFFAGRENRMYLFEDDVHVAALSLYAAYLFPLIVEYSPMIDAVAYFFNRERCEGYWEMHDRDKPETHDSGIKLIDYDIPQPKPEDFEVGVVK